MFYQVKVWESLGNYRPVQYSIYILSPTLSLMAMLHIESDASSGAGHWNLLFHNSTTLVWSGLLQPGLSSSEALLDTYCTQHYQQRICSMFLHRLCLDPQFAGRIVSIWKKTRGSSAEIKRGIFFKSPEEAFCRPLQGLLSAIWGGRQSATLCAQQPAAHWRREIKHNPAFQ